MDIRTFRQERKLTLAQLGSAVGVTKGYLSQIENGITGCSAQLALRLEKYSQGAIDAAALNKSVADSRMGMPAGLAA